MKKRFFFPLLLIGISFHAQVGINTAFPQEGLDIASGTQFRNHIRLGGTDYSKGDAGTINQILTSQGENNSAKWKNLKDLSDYQALVNQINQLQALITSTYNANSTAVYAYAEEPSPSFSANTNLSTPEFTKTVFESQTGLLVNGVFTAPLDGAYWIACRGPMKRGSLGGSDSGTRTKLLLYVNNIAIANYESAIVVKTNFENLSEVTFSRLVSLKAGDKLRIGVTNSGIAGGQTGNNDFTDQGLPSLAITKIN
ncbi:hypothetical protein [Chryseobacterium sp.]|uniref:hypothetical protein n=1 Tax=Chryseobacterium sp. TaxID=1871047 RepID=UPI0025BB363D|nr:hypothetical protein [Chryseobacterium sp.]